MKIATKSALTAVAITLAATLAGCAAAGPSQPAAEAPEVSTETNFAAGSTMSDLQEAGKITIGTKFDQPLFGLKNPITNAPEGFDVEIGKIIAGALGIPAEDITWVETVSANREPFVQQGRVDLVIATYTMTEQRAEVVNLAGPYYVAGQSLMILAGNPKKIAAPEDLDGLTACSVEGSASSTNIRELVPGAKVVTFDAYSKCADALKNGQVDAVTTDNTILAGMRSLDPDTFELVDVTFTEEPYGIGIGIDRTDLKDFVNETLEEAFADGAWHDAWERTAGTVLGDPGATPALGVY